MFQKMLKNIDKGFHRRVSFPLWKWLIVITIIAVDIFLYVLSMVSFLPFMFFAVALQFVWMILLFKFDTNK